MIVNFSIKNFGPIKDNQTLSFEAENSTHLENEYVITTKSGYRILKLGLIYGANASGKTTILKALDFLRNLVLEPEEKKNSQLSFSPFLFDSETPHQPSTLAIEFIYQDIKYSYEVEFDKSSIIREELNHYKPTKANIFKRSTDLENRFTEIKFMSRISVDKIYKKTLESNTLWNNTVLGGYLKTNIQIEELRNVTAWFEDNLKPLVLTNTELDSFVMGQIDSGEIDKADVSRILRKADFNISDILIEKKEEDIPEGFIDFIQTRVKTNPESIKTIIDRGKITALNLEFEHSVNNVKYKLPFNLESQGTQRYFGFAGLLVLMIKNSVIFPIDELETSLHPDLYNHFILSFLMNTSNSQLIATTHNREILNNRDIYRNDAIWFADKNENSYTTLYSLADFDSSVVRNTSNVYNAYKIGKLGAVPNIGDHYFELADAEK